MKTSDIEKDLLRRISGQDLVSEEKIFSGQETERKPAEKPKKKGNGLADVAGMNELKDFIKEGFINVLKNRKCAEAYGIKPPSMLFYGPAGCGKTFFAEKIAEELGIFGQQ